MVRPGFELTTFELRVKCLAQGHNTVVRPGFELTTFELRVKCLAQGHNTVVRPGFELTTFGLRVKCLAQGHTTQWSARGLRSGRGLNSRPLGYKSDTQTARPLRPCLVNHG